MTTLYDSSSSHTLRLAIAGILVALGCAATTGCFATSDEPRASSESAATACLACDGEGLDESELDLALADGNDDGDANGGGGSGSSGAGDGAGDDGGAGSGMNGDFDPGLRSSTPASSRPAGLNGNIGIKNDAIVPVGNVKVGIPQLKGDRCHAGGAAVHITVTDANRNVYKMIPVNEGGRVVWKTVDGRPGPSRSVMKAILGNQRVVSAMAKIAKFMGLGCGAIVFFGYDSYVSAGETGGYRILDKIKSLRTVQEICSTDENGVMRPVLPRNGTVPGGAPSGNDLKWEVIWDNQYGLIYTTYYLEPDCSWLERRFGCSLTKKVWVIGPDQHQQIPNGCLMQ